VHLGRRREPVLAQALSTEGASSAAAPQAAPAPCVVGSSRLGTSLPPTLLSSKTQVPVHGLFNMLNKLVCRRYQSGITARITPAQLRDTRIAPVESVDASPSWGGGCRCGRWQMGFIADWCACARARCAYDPSATSAICTIRWKLRVLELWGWQMARSRWWGYISIPSPRWWLIRLVDTSGPQHAGLSVQPWREAVLIQHILAWWIVVPATCATAPSSPV